MSNSSSSTKVVHSGGIGFGGLLAAIFITLKLCGVIAWAWWWVLSPLWIPVGLGLFFFLAGAVVGGLALLLNKSRRSQTPEQRLSNACLRMSAELRK